MQWETYFWFSTFPSAAVVGLCGMGESRSGFQGLWKRVLLSSSPSFPQAGLIRRRIEFCFSGLLDSIAWNAEGPVPHELRSEDQSASCRSGDGRLRGIDAGGEIVPLKLRKRLLRQDAAVDAVSSP